MPATAVTDKLLSSVPRWSGKVGTGGVANGTATTIPLSSSTNLTNGGIYIFTVNRVDSGGEKNTLAEMETVIGELSGANFINCVRGVEGTAGPWDADTVVEVLFTSAQWNKLIEWAEAEHNQDGTHKGALVTTLKATGAEINTGTNDAKIVTPKAIEDSDLLSKTSPQIVTSINDTNNNEIIKITPTASAVNELELVNSVTGNPPQLNSSGDDTNIDQEINPKGTGVIKAKTTLELELFAADTDMEVKDAVRYFRVPKELVGMKLVDTPGAVNYTAGVTGTCDIQIRNKTQVEDLLSTKITIDTTETDSSTAATPPVIGTHTALALGDIIAIDVDAIHTGTVAKGGLVYMTFAKP